MCRHWPRPEIFAGADGPFAGKPAPTRIRVITTLCVNTGDPCGSGLARERAGTATTYFKPCNIW
ncbi:hypothetical protein FQ185_03525 [Pseudomonas sp. ANT_H12B]|nr:hypothetical protein FQ185_03525 [Pseudomonas sp. ANT_H12B]